MCKDKKIVEIFFFIKKYTIFASLFGGNSIGEMAEWSIAAVLKTVVLRGTGGSNPSLSAKQIFNMEDSNNVAVFFYYPVKTCKFTYKGLIG